MVFEVQLQYLVVDIAVFELVSLVVIACKELVGNFLMANGTDGGEKLVHIEGIELRLEELRSEYILVTERRCSYIIDGIASHIGNTWFPSGDKGFELLVFQTYLLYCYWVLGIAQFLLEHELLVKRLIDSKRHRGYFVDKPFIHLVFVFLKPIVFAKVHTSRIAHTSNTLRSRLTCEFQQNHHEAKETNVI